MVAEQILDDALKQLGGSLQALEKALDEQASSEPTVWYPVIPISLV